jgi:hypothetical protein
VTVTPTDDTTVEPGETVILTLGTGAGYLVGSPNNATVTIADNEPTVTVSATDADAAEAGTDPGTFTITRSNTNGNLVVNYTVGGTATSASDYSALSGSVTIASGQTSATVTVTPINDAAVDPSETVILSLSSSTSYVVGTPSTATVTIADNDTYSVTVAATDASAAEGGGNKHRHLHRHPRRRYQRQPGRQLHAHRHGGQRHRLHVAARFGDDRQRPGLGHGDRYADR